MKENQAIKRLIETKDAADDDDNDDECVSFLKKSLMLMKDYKRKKNIKE